MVVGYARVSTPEQKLESQINLLKNAGCDKIYSDIVSGTRDDRKGLNEMLKYLRKGDMFKTYKNDSMFRSLRIMIEFIDAFNEKEVPFKSLSEPEFDITSANGKFFLQIFASIAEFELNLISERTKVGLVNARNRKKLLGRPKGTSNAVKEKYNFVKHLYDNMDVLIKEAFSRVKISESSFYKVEKEMS